MDKDQFTGLVMGWVFIVFIFFTIPYVLGLTGLVPEPIFMYQGRNLFDIALIVVGLGGFIGIITYASVKGR